MTTLAQKIIAKASNQPSAKVGEVVVCAVDLAMIQIWWPEAGKTYSRKVGTRCGIKTVSL